MADYSAYWKDHKDFVVNKDCKFKVYKVIAVVDPTDREIRSCGLKHKMRNIVYVKDDAAIASPDLTQSQIIVIGLDGVTIPHYDNVKGLVYWGKQFWKDSDGFSSIFGEHPANEIARQYNETVRPGQPRAERIVLRRQLAFSPSYPE